MPTPVVYRRRRLAVGGAALVVLVLLVVLIVSVLHHGGRSSAEKASTDDASAPARPTGGTSSAASVGTSKAPVQPAGGSSSPSSSSSSAQDGCDPSDVTVVPSVAAGNTAPSNGAVAVTLSLTTIKSPLCAFDVSVQTVQVAVVQGTATVWLSSQCPASIPEQKLVLQPDEPSRVTVTWDGHVSAPGCPVGTRWAGTGSYVLKAAALGGEPSSVKFKLAG